MRVLIAEDDLISRRILEATLRKWEFEVVVTCDGQAAWQALQQPDAPRLAVLDWMMPGLDGVDLCRRVRAAPALAATYMILVTAKASKHDVVAGLDAGADDYVTKPFNREELRARLGAGRRIVELQDSLALRVQQLEESLAQVKQLQGLLPICCYCKKVRDDSNYWQQVEGYLAARANVQFSHGICPDCWDVRVVPELAARAAQRSAADSLTVPDVAVG